MKTLLNILRYVLGKKESDPSLKPPKQWWEKMMLQIRQGNPSYSEETIEKTIGDIWYHNLTDSKRSEIRERYGKTYG